MGARQRRTLTGSVECKHRSNDGIRVFISIRPEAGDEAEFWSAHADDRRNKEEATLPDAICLNLSSHGLSFSLAALAAADTAFAAFRHRLA